jgi:protein phosphatase PTC7
MALTLRSTTPCLNTVIRLRPATLHHSIHRSCTQQHQPQSFHCSQSSTSIYCHARSFSSTSSTRIQAASPTSSVGITSPTYTYRLAASFCGKSHAFDPSSHYFTFSSETNKTLLSGHIEYTRDSGRIPSGQDACFVSRLGDSGIALGLADGVGGWADQGIDPSDFSHGLCNRMADESEKYQGEGEEKDLPRRILQRAFDDISKDESIPGGGSTACVGVVDWQGRHTAAK